MKTLIIILLASLSTVAQVKPEKLTKVSLSVHTFMSEEETLYCGTQDGIFFLNKKNIIFKCDKVQLDLKVLRRKIGRYDSWLTYSKGTYYFVTALNVQNQGFGLMFQPVEFNLMRRYDIPSIVISTVDLCD